MAADNDQAQRKLINGVFSSQEVKKVGTGTTSRKTIQKTFWFCKEMDDGQLEVQPLNPNYVPSGPKKMITMDQFLSTFSPEPELYVSNVYPKMRELNKTIARGDRHREKEEYFSAEMEYGNALKVDEENVRANFGLGITYLERGESSKAENIFERLVKLEAAFEQEHKHLFNEFGIKLRKNGMIDQAVTYYERAMELAVQDENLLYNLARAYLEKKDIEHCLDYLIKSLELNPGLEVSIKFILWLVSKNLVPETRKGDINNALLAVKRAKEGGAPAKAAAPAPKAPAAPAAAPPDADSPLELPALDEPAQTASVQAAPAPKAPAAQPPAQQPAPAAGGAPRGARPGQTPGRGAAPQRGAPAQAAPQSAPSAQAPSSPPAGETVKGA